MEAEKAKVKGKAKSKGPQARVQKAIGDSTTPPAKRRKLSGDVKYLITPPKTPKKPGKALKGATSSAAKLAHPPHSPTYAKQPDYPATRGPVRASLPRNSSDSSLSTLSRFSMAPEMDGGIGEIIIPSAVNSTSVSASIDNPNSTLKSILVERQDHRRGRLNAHPYPTPPRVISLGSRTRTEFEEQEDQHGNSLDLLASAALSMERVHLDQRGYVAYGSGDAVTGTSKKLRIEPEEATGIETETFSSISVSTTPKLGTPDDDSDTAPLSSLGHRKDYDLDSNPVRSRTVVNSLESAGSAAPTRRIRARV